MRKHYQKKMKSSNRGRRKSKEINLSAGEVERRSSSTPKGNPKMMDGV